MIPMRAICCIGVLLLSPRSRPVSVIPRASNARHRHTRPRLNLRVSSNARQRLAEPASGANSISSKRLERGSWSDLVAGQASLVEIGQGLQQQCGRLRRRTIKMFTRSEDFSDATNTDMAYTPLLDAMVDVQKTVKAAFFVPGHKMGRAMPSRIKSTLGDFHSTYRSDLTEIAGLDNLANPEEAIREAEILAAKAFGAGKTFFLVNGSTSGIIAAIVACVAEYRRKYPASKYVPRILLPRNAHMSATHGLVVSGGMPVWLGPEVDEKSRIPLPITPAQLTQALQESGSSNVAAVFIVSPSYFGVISDIAGISEVCRDFKVPLIVDEAHGAHLKILPKAAGLASSLDLGADVVVQSTHKMLGSLTQSAMLHLSKGSMLPEYAIRKAIPLVQSSSPSYILMASLDAARWQMANEGEYLGSELFKLAQTTRERLREIPGIDIVTQGGERVRRGEREHTGSITVDPTRVTILPTKSGITGYELAKEMEKMGVFCELSSESHVVLALSIGNTYADVDLLIRAVRDSVTILRREKLAETKDEAVSSLMNRGIPDEKTVSLPAAPIANAFIPLVSPRKAHFAQREIVRTERAYGRLSAETICPYPPGIPVLIPGEEVTEAIVDYLRSVRDSGGKVVGATDSTLKTLAVLMM